MASMVFVGNKAMAPMTKILEPGYKVIFLFCLFNTRLISCDSQDYSCDYVHCSTIKISATSTISNSF